MKMLNQLLLEDETINQAYHRGKAFFVDCQDQLATHRARVKDRLESALQEFRLSLKPRELATVHLSGLVTDTSEYVKWLGWSLDDIGYYSISLGVDPEVIVRRIVACHFVYQSGRLFDDIIDGHGDYKGLRQTSYGARLEYWSDQGKPDHAGKECLLVAIALLLRGIRDYSTCFGEQVPVSALRNLLNTVTNACLGAIIELNEHIPHTMESYEQIVKLKTSAHNAILLQPFYGVISPEIYHQLADFYQRSSQAGQIFNDAFDIEEDIEIGQINYFNFEGTERAGTSLTMAEVGILTTILHELAASIEQNHHGLHLACYAKFSTFIDSAAQIEVQ